MTALWGVKSIRLATQKTRKDRKSHRLSGDKGEGKASIESGCWTQRLFISSGAPQAHVHSVEKHFQEGSAELQILHGTPGQVGGARDDKGEGKASIESGCWTQGRAALP